MFGESRLVEKKSGVQVISLNLDFTFDDKISFRLSVVNSKEEILALPKQLIKLFLPKDTNMFHFMWNHSLPTCLWKEPSQLLKDGSTMKKKYLQH